jgi:hypothetical protein
MPMKYFDGMGQRERTMTPYLDDDCDMLGLQFNVGAYTAKDRIFEDGAKYGLTGVAPWMVEPRGTEANSSFLAEADWNPRLTLQQFYHSYSERLFGSDAASDMYQAFLALEDNQAYLDDQSPGYGTDQRPVTISCCGIMADVRLVQSYSQQANPFDGPKDPGWVQFVLGAPQQIGMYEGAIARLEKALAHMTAAQAKVDPRGKHELEYLKNRTEAYRDTIRALITQRKAILAFDLAFRKRNAVSNERFVADLDASSKLFADAAEKAKVATAKYAEIIDFPSDLENLYNLNVQAMLGYDLIRQWMQKIVNFQAGKPYTEHVPFERLIPQRDVQVARSNAVVD